jgi:hypothetical protein
MKTLTKIVIASALALSAAAPAFAYDTGVQSNAQVSTARAQQITGKHVDAARAADAMAFAPGDAADFSAKYFHDFGIGSQS